MPQLNARSHVLACGDDQAYADARANRHMKIVEVLPRTNAFPRAAPFTSVSKEVGRRWRCSRRARACCSSPASVFSQFDRRPTIGRDQADQSSQCRGQQVHANASRSDLFKRPSPVRRCGGFQRQDIPGSSRQDRDALGATEFNPGIDGRSSHSSTASARFVIESVLGQTRRPCRRNPFAPTSCRTGARQATACPGKDVRE